MGLVYFSKNPVDWYALEGVYIALTQPPAPASISANAGMTKIVGEFPWGPVGEVIEADTGQKFNDNLVGQAASPEDYKGVISVKNKQWGELVVSRVGASGQAKSTVTMQDSVPADAYKIEAKYVGAVGDEIAYDHVDTGSGTFELTITWGDKSTKYTDLTLSTADLDDGIDDDFVNVTLLDVSAGVPADETGNLAGGSDGTPGDSDYSDALDVLTNADDGGTVFAAEYTSAAWISALENHINALNRTYGIAQADAADDVATNITSAESLSTKKLILAGHRVSQFVDSTLTKVDLAPWLASVLANIAPNKSLAAYSASEWLTPIRGFGGGITAPSRADYINAREAGLVLLEQDEGDWIPKSGLTSDGDKVNRIRMEGIVGFNIGEALKPFKSEPSYPSNKTAARVAMERKMDVLAGTEDVPESQLIRGHNIFEIDATATSVLYKVDVKTFGDMDSIIANVTVGPTVDIEIE